jgi:hypothetical protein
MHRTSMLHGITKINKQKHIETRQDANESNNPYAVRIKITITPIKTQTSRHYIKHTLITNMYFLRQNFFSGLSLSMLFVICGFGIICATIFATLPGCCLALLLHPQPTAPRSLRSHSCPLRTAFLFYNFSGNSDFSFSIGLGFKIWLRILCKTIIFNYGKKMWIRLLTISAWLL